MKAVLTSKVLLNRSHSTCQLFYNPDPSLRCADNPTAVAHLLLPLLQGSLTATKCVCIHTKCNNTFPTGAGAMPKITLDQRISQVPDNYQLPVTESRSQSLTTLHCLTWGAANIKWCVTCRGQICWQNQWWWMKLELKLQFWLCWQTKMHLAAFFSLICKLEK